MAAAAAAAAPTPMAPTVPRGRAKTDRPALRPSPTVDGADQAACRSMARLMPVVAAGSDITPIWSMASQHLIRTVRTAPAAALAAAAAAVARPRGRTP